MVKTIKTMVKAINAMVKQAFMIASLRESMAVHLKPEMAT
jgi:hypothetical protein